MLNLQSHRITTFLQENTSHVPALVPRSAKTSTTLKQKRVMMTKNNVAKQSDLNPNLQLKAHPSLESIHRKPDLYTPIEGSHQCHLMVMILRIGTLTHQPHHHSPFPKENLVPRLKGTKPKVRGVFETKEHTLKKTVTIRKYHC